MNANELADKLMSSLTMEYDCDKYMKQAATMLRAQADLIEVLRSQPNIDYDKELLKPTFVGRELTELEILDIR